MLIFSRCLIFLRISIYFTDHILVQGSASYGLSEPINRKDCNINPTCTSEDSTNISSDDYDTYGLPLKAWYNGYLCSRSSVDAEHQVPLRSARKGLALNSKVSGTGVSARSKKTDEYNEILKNYTDSFQSGAHIYYIRHDGWSTQFVRLKNPKANRLKTSSAVSGRESTSTCANCTRSKYGGLVACERLSYTAIVN